MNNPIFYTEYSIFPTNLFKKKKSRGVVRHPQDDETGNLDRDINPQNKSWEDSVGVSENTDRDPGIVSLCPCTSPSPMTFGCVKRHMWE